MREFLTRDNIILVAHNGIRYDIPALERLLGIKVKCKVVCSLAISWYLEPNRLKHGLAEWGEEFGDYCGPQCGMEECLTGCMS